MDGLTLSDSAPVREDGASSEAVMHPPEMRQEAVGASATAGEQTSGPMTVQALTDKALHFLSHASNETLGACLVGLGATTYLVLGRVGLVLMGIVGGVVLHATWDGVRSDSRDEETKQAERVRRQEAGVEVAKRLLDGRPTRIVDGDKGDLPHVYTTKELDFSGFEPETAAALTTFTDAIIKDYVHYWYDPTIPGETSFPASAKQTLIAFLLSLSGHLSRKRPADAFLDFVTNASSIIIVFLNELAAALNASPNASAEEAVAFYLENKPDSSLSYMLHQDSQTAKLADAAEDILQAYLDPKAYNCAPVRVFMKQVLAHLILGYTVSYCSTPEFINEWIVYGLEESKTTKEVMDMVDAGVEGRAKVDTPVKAVKQGFDKQEAVFQNDGASAVQPAKPERPVAEHKRQLSSRAEDAMDEAMAEAKRLTQLMIEEDERRAQDEQTKRTAASSSEDVSDAATHGAATPTSSQSDRERQNEDAATWTTESSSAVESPITTGEQPMTPTTTQQFTSFDQLLPSQLSPTFNDSPERSRHEPAQLTLHNARISIFDDSQPHERTAIKARPTIDYLVQIEPSSSAFPGWMIARKYADFEMLHEVLRRISVITGVPGFTQAHAELPRWKTNTKASLRSELERYLTDAVRFQPLAESEGMKRFLEKDQGASARSPGERAKGFGWPTPDAFGKFGGGMMDVLTKAPKQVAGSGKMVFGGVAGLVGGKKINLSQANFGRRRSGTGASDAPGTPDGGHKSKGSTDQPYMTDSYLGSMSSLQARQSQESIHSIPKQILDRAGSIATTASGELKPRPSGPSSTRASTELDRSVTLEAVGDAAADEASPTQGGKLSTAEHAEASPTASRTHLPNLTGGLEAAVDLPPPPSEITDDFGSPKHASKRNRDSMDSSRLGHALPAPADTDVAPPPPPRPTKPVPKPKEPITERETTVTIELLFAIITELYTLSSAWQFRRTLLLAAKNFLLRPGNPTLLSIRDMLQTSLLDSNLSDAGIAAHVYKLRENGLPTAEEMEAWKRDYPEKSAEEKEELRVKARRLLVGKGMPQALTSVMGQAASGEALGRVFDALQVGSVGRGVVYGVLLQAIRIVTD